MGCRFLLFSWPSDDAVLNYTLDEADIYWSVAYIEQMLQRMIRSFGAGSIELSVTVWAPAAFPVTGADEWPVQQ